jgi:hypothetical protein
MERTENLQLSSISQLDWQSSIWQFFFLQLWQIDWQVLLHQSGQLGKYQVLSEIALQLSRQAFGEVNKNASYS